MKNVIETDVIIRIFLTKMEKAIIIYNFKNFKISKLKNFDRIYYGNEFCPNLLPEVNEIKQNLKFIKKINKPISLLTSYVGNDDLAKYKSVINYLVKQKIIDEIIVNDLGIFNFCQNKYPNIKLVFGRFLAHYSIMRHSRFFKVGRYEYDRNIFSNSAKLKKTNRSNKISFYYPYSVIQGTRYCSLVNSSNGKINQGIVKCQKECLKIGPLRLNNSLLKNSIILFGNVQLVKVISENKIKKIKDIDRIVYQYYDFKKL